MRLPEWDEVLEQAKDGRYRFLTIEENNGMGQQCGLIRHIYTQGENIVFDMIWMGATHFFTTGWYALNKTFIRISDQTEVEYEHDSAAAFVLRVPEVGLFKVFRNNTIRLDPAEIRGIDPIHVRKTRAIVYGLGEDADWPAIVERVVKDLGGDGLTDADEQLAVQEDAQRFAA